jgi:hypothetical protein
MAILQTTYDIVLRGQLDPSLLALVAEYDLGDLPAQVVLQGLPVDPTTLDALLLRAHALGLTVVQVRPVDADPS